MQWIVFLATYLHISWARAQYFAFALIRATTCILLLQVIKISPQKCTILWCRTPISLGSIPVSISIHFNVSYRGLFEENPFALIYFEVSQNSVYIIHVGLCRSVHELTALTANPMSGHVCERYISFPTNLWYLLLSTIGRSQSSPSLTFASIGVSTGLLPYIPVSFKSSKHIFPLRDWNPNSQKVFENPKVLHSLESKAFTCSISS